MPVNTKATAPTITAVSVLIFDHTTKFINVQNTDPAVNMRAGFAAADLIASGVRILPGETYPIPLDGNQGNLFLVSEGADLTDKAIIVRG